MGMLFRQMLTNVDSDLDPLWTMGSISKGCQSVRSPTLAKFSFGDLALKTSNDGSSTFDDLRWGARPAAAEMTAPLVLWAPGFVLAVARSCGSHRFVKYVYLPNIKIFIYHVVLRYMYSSPRNHNFSPLQASKGRWPECWPPRPRDLMTRHR